MIRLTFSDHNSLESQIAMSVDSKKSGLFGVFKKSRSNTPDNAPTSQDQAPEPNGFLTRLKTRLSRTRSSLVDGLSDLFLGKKTIDEEVLEELETRLLLADVGVEATATIIDKLTEQFSRKQLTQIDTLLQALRDEMLSILQPCSQILNTSQTQKPYVILMVGVNGVGKTTTIGKLAKSLQTQGQSVMLAAGDTFRAAAVEQLQIWGERNRIPVIAQQSGADAASVIYDAVQAAQARQVDVIIADTAGRLHTQSNLMEELKKIKRVIGKLDRTAPHEIMLVVDAGTGQNALSQAVQFHNAIGLSGITLTKLDGTAKGGIIFAIAQRLGVPIRFIGVGEGVEDLREFNAEEFIDALLST